MVHVHIESLFSGVSLTSSRGISPFLHSLGQGMMNLPQTVRCDSSCSTSMGMLQKSHLTSRLGQSSCRCFLSMDFSSSAPQRLGHITGTNLQSSKWACQKFTRLNCTLLSHIGCSFIYLYFQLIIRTDADLQIF